MGVVVVRGESGHMCNVHVCRNNLYVHMCNVHVWICAEYMCIYVYLCMCECVQTIVFMCIVHVCMCVCALHTVHYAQTANYFGGCLACGKTHLP